MIAYCLIREHPHYRRAAFVEGLRRAGYKVRHGMDRSRPQPGDVLVTWNRTGDDADRWERMGGRVLVAENGYIGLDAHGVQLYALAVGGHNGSGKWPHGGGERWQRLGIDLKPWRERGEFVLVRGQRGIGSRAMASPPNWHDNIAAKLRLHHRVVVQPHPGKPACDPYEAARLVGALRGCHAAVIWSSAAGVRALVEGVPVYYDAPHWICAGAALRLGEVRDLNAPKMDDGARLAALERMAWAQWTVAELESGEPFVRLREC